MSAAWRPRRLLMALGLAALLVLGAHPLAPASSDIWGNVGPAGAAGGRGPLARFPLSHYVLDQHFDVVSASLTGGLDVSGVPPMIAYFLATVLWLLTTFLANVLISLFGFAFDLDLLNGSAATGGQGALAPVAIAIHSIYANVFGQPWLVLAVAVLGVWAMWKALVQRRYTETAGALGLSLIYVVGAMFFVAEPSATIGTASKWTNQMSESFLAISDHGDPSGGSQAQQDGSDQLFELLVAKPWAVLEFGGVEHCVLEGTGSENADPESAPVRPLASDPDRDAALSRRLQAGAEIHGEGKTCINNVRKYGAHFLRFASGSDERDAEYEALNDGDASKLPEADQAQGGYRLGVADKPATDAMEEGGQYQRLLIALVVFVGEVGAFCLLGALSVGVILAQVFLLLLLAFAPIALVAAAIPGRGHYFFKSWLSKLAGFLLRKAAYSLILAVVLAVNGALAGASSPLGWLMSFGLQSLFFWGVFIQRKTLTDSLVGIATGPRAPAAEKATQLLSVYYGARFLSQPARSVARGAMRGAAAGGRLSGRLLRGNPEHPPTALKDTRRLGKGQHLDPRGRSEQGGQGRPAASADRQVFAGKPAERPRRKPDKRNAAARAGARDRKAALTPRSSKSLEHGTQPASPGRERDPRPSRKPARAENLLLAELRAEGRRAARTSKAPKPPRAAPRPHPAAAEQRRTGDRPKRRPEKGEGE